MAGMAGHCWRFIGSYVYREGGRDGGGGKERGGERLSCRWRKESEGVGKEGRGQEGGRDGGERVEDMDGGRNGNLRALSQKPSWIKNVETPEGFMSHSSDSHHPVTLDVLALV